LIFDEVMTGFRWQKAARRSALASRGLELFWQSDRGGLPSALLAGDLKLWIVCACRAGLSSWHPEWQSGGDGGGNRRSPRTGSH